MKNVLLKLWTLCLFVVFLFFNLQCKSNVDDPDCQANVYYLYPYDKVMERTASYGFWRNIQYFTILDSNSNILITTSLRGYIWQDFSTSGRVSLIWSDRGGNDYSYNIMGDEKYLFSSDSQLLEEDLVKYRDSNYKNYQEEDAIVRTWDIHYWDLENYEFPVPKKLEPMEE